MNNELNLPNNSYPLDALVALSELQDDVEKAQAAAAAKMEELAALRAQTAELFAERLRAEGADDEAVSAAKAIWAENPSLAAQAALGADIIEAANPYGCNQYGEGWKQAHNGKQSKKGSPVKKDDSSPAADKKETKETTKKGDSSPAKKGDTTQEEKKQEHKFEDYKDDMAEALLSAIERFDYFRIPTSVYFDGEEFSTYDKNGGLTVFFADDIIELRDELEAYGFDSMREAVFEYIDNFGREHFDNIDFNYLKK